MKRLVVIPLIVILSALVVPYVCAWTVFRARVVEVINGDTIKVKQVGDAWGMLDGRTIRREGPPEIMLIRLNGVDCPEREQSYCTEAKRLTSDLVFGREVFVLPRGRDGYGRTLADVYIGDKTLDRGLNTELVRQGLAWWYRKYAPHGVLKKLEEEARVAKRGLWSDPNPVPPWEWRKSRKR